MAAKMRRNLEFDTPYTVTNALSKGGAETKLSALVMGLGNMAHKQVLKGLLFLAAEVAYIAFMVTNGVHNLQMLITLGSWSARRCGTRSCRCLNTRRATSPSCFCSMALRPSF